MSLIYITGPAGSGKSTVQKELSTLGHTAYDIDDSRFGGPVNKLTGESTVVPPLENRSSDWFEKHEWRISRSAIEDLKKASEHTNVFLCGTAATEQTVWDLFDKVVYLDIDEATLRHRIASRQDNDFGKTNEELQIILERYKLLQENRSKHDVVTINATQDIASVVNQIIGAQQPNDKKT